MRAFYELRIARILPNLLLLIGMVNLLAIGGVAIFQNHAQGDAAISFWIVDLASLTFWMNVLIITQGWASYPLGVLWSLSIEEVFYLSFPIFCLALRREVRLLAFWAVIIVIGPLYRLSHQSDDEAYLYGYFACFDGIAIGCSTAVLARRISLHGPVAVILQIGTVAAMTVLYFCRPIEQTNVFGVTAMALGTAVLLLVSDERSSNPRPLTGAFSAAVGWLGRLSYELYLFHLVALGALRTVFPPRATAGDEKLLLLFVFLALSVVSSASIARFYAEPLNRGIRRRRLASPSAPAVL